MRARSRPQSAPAQLSLFDPEPKAPADKPAPLRAPLVASQPLPANPPASAPSRRLALHAMDQRVSRVLSVDDMPAYSDEAHQSIAAALKALPQTQLWFTYKNIQFFFGVSRATVARRLREGLVPGVRMAGSSVIEDSPVRRFDRDQLKWLLLAVRHRARQLTC